MKKPLSLRRNWAELVRVGHASGLDDGEPAVPFPLPLDVLEHDPGVHEGGDADFGLLSLPQGEVRLVKQGRDLPCLQEIDEAGEHRFHVACETDGDKVRDGVHDDDMRLKLFTSFVIWRRCISRPEKVGLSERMIRSFLSMNGPRSIPAERMFLHDLFRGFFEGKVETPLTPFACAFRELGCHGRFPCACRTGDEDAASPVSSPCRRTWRRARAMPVEILSDGTSGKAKRGDGEYGDAVLVDKKGVFVGAVV